MRNWNEKISPAFAKINQKSIVVIIDYFGKWPEWFPAFLMSCRFNPSVDWLIHTDCPIPPEHPKNVHFKKIDYKDYCRRVSRKLRIRFRPASPYKIADLKVTFGYLYEDQIKSFDYFAFGDLDVVYGNIRRFYSSKVLEHNIISASERMITGHLTLIKNVKWLRTAFKNIPHWRDMLEMPVQYGYENALDEAAFSDLFLGTRRYTFPIKKNKKNQNVFRSNNYFVEQYPTPYMNAPWIGKSSKHPSEWYWKDGVVKSCLDKNHQYLYLHFSTFKSPKCRAKRFRRRPSWKNVKKIVRFRWENWDPKKDVLIINERGLFLKK